jgi:hypothetical protein
VFPRGQGRDWQGGEKGGGTSVSGSLRARFDQSSRMTLKRLNTVCALVSGGSGLGDSDIVLAGALGPAGVDKGESTASLLKSE